MDPPDPDPQHCFLAKYLVQIVPTRNFELVTINRKNFEQKQLENTPYSVYVVVSDAKVAKLTTNKTIIKTGCIC
jgi:hypothetical protein